MDKTVWEKVFQDGKDFSPLNLVFLEKLLERISSLRKKRGCEKPPATLVDFGCGTGDTILKFAARGIAAQGIDWSRRALDKAKLNAQKKSLEEKVVWTLLDLGEISVSKIVHNPSDLIVSKLTYAFIDQKEKFLNSVVKLLSPCSVFILITPVLHQGFIYSDADKPKIAVDFEETKKLLEKNFGYVEEFHHDYFGEKGDEVTFLVMK